jgi:hypothetical protein
LPFFFPSSVLLPFRSLPCPLPSFVPPPHPYYLADKVGTWCGFVLSFLFFQSSVPFLPFRSFLRILPHPYFRAEKVGTWPRCFFILLILLILCSVPSVPCRAVPSFVPSPIPTSVRKRLGRDVDVFYPSYSSNPLFRFFRSVASFVPFPIPTSSRKRLGLGAGLFLSIFFF